MSATRKINLESQAAKLADDTFGHPRIYELPPPAGRDLLIKLQSGPVQKAPVKIETMPFDCGKNGSIEVKLVIPDSLPKSSPPNVIYYVHGAGWVLGNFTTHEKLACELAFKCQSVVIFPEYTLSPEAKFPVALEQMGALLDALPKLAKERGWSLDKLTIAGDSVGGNMAAVLAKRGGEGLRIHKQVLFYPVTSAAMNTKSYEEFADGYYLTKDGMAWFWDQYIPNPADRKDKRASPLENSVEELKGLPPALVINAEADVLRDEGIAYSDKLREAGVEVEHHTFPAMVHDFVMLNCLDDTKACRGAMDKATEWINKRNKE